MARTNYKLTGAAGAAIPADSAVHWFQVGSNRQSMLFDYESADFAVAAADANLTVSAEGSTDGENWWPVLLATPAGAHDVAAFAATVSVTTSTPVTTRVWTSWPFLRLGLKVTSGVIPATATAVAILTD